MAPAVVGSIPITHPIPLFAISVQAADVAGRRPTRERGRPARTRLGTASAISSTRVEPQRWQATAPGLCFARTHGVTGGRAGGSYIAGILSGSLRQCMRAGRPRSRVGASFHHSCCSRGHAPACRATALPMRQSRHASWPFVVLRGYLYSGKPIDVSIATNSGKAIVTYSDSERRSLAGGTTLAWISKRRHNTRRAGSIITSARPNLRASGIVTQLYNHQVSDRLSMEYWNAWPFPTHHGACRVPSGGDAAVSGRPASPRQAGRCPPGVVAPRALGPPHANLPGHLRAPGRDPLRRSGAPGRQRDRGAVADVGRNDSALWRRRSQLPAPNHTESGAHRLSHLRSQPQSALRQVHCRVASRSTLATGGAASQGRRRLPRSGMARSRRG